MLTFTGDIKALQGILKDERRTSNIERSTSNENVISNTDHSTFIFVSFHPFTEYSRSLFHRLEVCFFIFSYSTFNVGRSMFNVHNFSVNLSRRPGVKNILALIGQGHQVRLSLK